MEADKTQCTKEHLAREFEAVGGRSDEGWEWSLNFANLNHRKGTIGRSDSCLSTLAKHPRKK